MHAFDSPFHLGTMRIQTYDKLPFLKQGFLERLKEGEKILVAEGYMWEFGRRGYLKYGGYIPEVVLDHPELVEMMHEEFVHAGTDVVEAFTVSYKVIR